MVEYILFTHLLTTPKPLEDAGFKHHQVAWVTARIFFIPNLCHLWPKVFKRSFLTANDTDSVRLNLKRSYRVVWIHIIFLFTNNNDIL